MGLALPVIRMQRKDVRNMKLAASFLAALLLTSTLGTLHNAIAEDGILQKNQLTGTNFACPCSVSRNQRLDFFVSTS